MEEEQHRSIPFHGRRLFHGRKLWNIFSPDFHPMPLEKIQVPYQGFQTCLPVWSRECNGPILGVRPGRREDSRTSVLVYPICGISTLHQDRFLEQLSCHSRLLESTAPVPLSLLLFISFSLALSLSPLPPFNFSCILLLQFDLG